MAPRLQALTVDAHDPELLALFWGRLLERDVVADPRGPLLAGTETQVGLRFVATTVAKTGPNRVHLHVTSATDADQDRQVARAIELGATHLDVGQRPAEGHVVLADPEGNELCVIEAGNGFLAGCGLLGELACDGSRDVGLFWAAALEWPLVWDEGEETAIQSPAGGTKVAWGGLSAPGGGAFDRLRLELVAEDPAVAADRLVALGATMHGPRDAAEVALADPDGTPFVLVRA